MGWDFFALYIGVICVERIAAERMFKEETQPNREFLDLCFKVVSAAKTSQRKHFVEFVWRFCSRAINPSKMSSKCSLTALLAARTSEKVGPKTFYGIGKKQALEKTNLKQ